MILVLPVRHSSAPDSSYILQVLEVDLELRLFQDDAEVFSVRSGQPPAKHPLVLGSNYIVRYNNNDAGPGAIHFQVCEVRGGALVRAEVNIGAIQSNDVRTWKLVLQRDTGLTPPSSAPAPIASSIGNNGPVSD